MNERSSKRRPAPLRKELTDMAAVNRLVREAGWIADDEPPAMAYAYFRANGAVQRVEALWASGWRARLSFRLNGSTELASHRTFVLRPIAAVAR